ncbi:uncharacterized protein LOC136764503 [Amia ocellicauda]|uniref:uncharacterized protein LOC136764503 n=1 Tax=Amia ocellicauda TaxID=2972642 RepID=UPI003463FD0C
MRRAVRTPMLLLLLLGAGTGQSSAQVQQLEGIVGETVSFPASVSSGVLAYRDGANIAQVSDDGTVRVYAERFSGRVRWDRESGFLRISELNTGDRGNYTVERFNGGKRVTGFQLTVYYRVSQPLIHVTDKGSPPESPCILLCSVSNWREVTLSWYRDREETPLKHTSSPDINSTLTLPLETEGLSHSYSCVATNPVSTETYTVNPADRCAVFQQVKGTVGDSVTLRAPVLKAGSLSSRDEGVIAEVSQGKHFTVSNDRFRGRVHWDSGSGHFQITGLSTQDSGFYTVDIEDAGGVQFLLTVHFQTGYLVTATVAQAIIMAVDAVGLLVLFLLHSKRRKQKDKREDYSLERRVMYGSLIVSVTLDGIGLIILAAYWASKPQDESPVHPGVTAFLWMIVCRVLIACGFVIWAVVYRFRKRKSNRENVLGFTALIVLYVGSAVTVAIGFLPGLIILAMCLFQREQREQKIEVTEGETVHFPIHTNHWILKLGSDKIAEKCRVEMAEKNLWEIEITDGRFKDRITSVNGFYCITDLKTEDAGVYTVQDLDENVFFKYKVTVLVALKGIEGYCVKIPCLVEGHIEILLKCRGVGVVATVTKGECKVTASTFTGRLNWDEDTRHFEITGLKTCDAGVYKVESKDGTKKVAKFDLTVLSQQQTLPIKYMDGERISIKAPVSQDRTLLYKGVRIAAVEQGKLRIYDKTFREKVTWEREGEHFDLSGLTAQDSGVYTVKNNAQWIIAKCHLTMNSAAQRDEEDVNTERDSLLNGRRQANFHPMALEQLQHP